MSDIPAEVNPGSSEASDPRGRHETDGRAPDVFADVRDHAAVANGAAHGSADHAASVHGADDVRGPANGPISTDGTLPQAPSDRPLRRARQRAEPREIEQAPALDAPDGTSTIEQAVPVAPAARGARRPRKKPDVAPPTQEPAGERGAAEQATRDVSGLEVAAGESGGAGVRETADLTDGPTDAPLAAASATLDVPYTPPGAYEPAPEPFANLAAVGGTLVTADAPSISADMPVITAEAAPITVELTPPPSPPAPPESAELAGQPTPPPSGDDEFDDEGGTMTIIEHLEELRKRLMWCLGAIAVGSFIGWFLAKPLVELAKVPLLGKADVITLTVFGAFVLQIKMAVAVGVCLSMPVTLTQIWGFVAPGLTRREKRYARPFVLLGSFLFLAGAAVGYFVFPKGVAFALTFNGSLGIKPTIEANGYVGFIAMIMVLFGIAFELPVFMVFLSLIGIFSSRAMLSRWRVAIVVIWASAMIVTPGADIVSPVILASILTVLYFLGIWLTKLVGR